MDTVTENDKITRNYEKRDNPDHPYCTNWPRSSNHISSSNMDRFDLEEQIQNVWQTKDDLDAIAERVSDDPDGPMSEDELVNVLVGLSELHETRMKKLWKVFETMVVEKSFVMKDTPLDYRGVPLTEDDK